jgi:hypothetical protein
MRISVWKQMTVRPCAVFPEEVEAVPVDAGCHSVLATLVGDAATSD